jgi:rubredoxin
MSLAGCSGGGAGSAVDSDAGGADLVALGGRFECKVCWQVYDPRVGDPVWQIAPGTPFAALPHHWTCPNCSTEQSGFLALPD